MFLHLRLSLTLIWQRHSNIFALLFNLFIFLHELKSQTKVAFIFLIAGSKYVSTETLTGVLHTVLLLGDYWLHLIAQGKSGISNSSALSLSLSRRHTRKTASVHAACFQFNNFSSSWSWALQLSLRLCSACFSTWTWNIRTALQKAMTKKNVIPLKAVMGGKLTQTMHRRPGEAVSRNQSCFSDGRFQYWFHK